MQGEAYLDIVWRQFKKHRAAYWSLWSLVPLFLLAIFAPLIASDKPLFFFDGHHVELDDGFWAKMSLDDKTNSTTFSLGGKNLKDASVGKALTLKADSQSYELKLIDPQDAKVKQWQFELVDESLATAMKKIGPSNATLAVEINGNSYSGQVGYTLYPWFRALFNQKDLVDYVFNMSLLGFFPWFCIAIITNLVCKKRDISGRQRIGIVFIEFFAITVFLIVFFSLPGFDGESRYAFRPNNKYYTRTFTVEQGPKNSKGISYGFYALIPFGPREQDLDSIYKGPGFLKEETEWEDSNDHWRHLLGTDDVGSDVLVRMIYGTRVSMTVGFVAVSIYLNIGIIVGAFAGYFGGKTDMFISRIIEIMLLFPAFFLILTLIGMIGPSIYIIMVVIGLTGWPTIARLIRGEVLKQRAIDYTSAAQALGASHTRVIFRHILPNSLAPALVAAPFGIANAIITEAGLSLLGFGVQPPAPTWGVLLRLAYSNYSYWWLIVVPSVAIFCVVTVFNLIGGGLRDAMDPKLRQ